MTRFIIRRERPGANTEYHGMIVNTMNYACDIATFRVISVKARNAFPGLSESEIECLVVQESIWCRGQACILFPLPKVLYPEGWQVVDRSPL